VTTITQKKKKSLSLWILLIAVFAAVIIIAVLSLLGFIDLAPIAVMYQSVFMWAAESVVNSVILTVGFVALGALGYYVIVKYFIGTKVTVGSTPGYGYNPQPTTPSTPTAQGTETVVS
jgi:hypothetical protein